MRVDCDVAVIGAGPSGAYLSYLLAKDGLKVLLMDKEPFPRDKVCGGGVSRKTLSLFDFDISAVIHRRIGGAYVTYQNAGHIVADVAGGAGVTVVRSEFDAFLVEKAQEAGATFLPAHAFVDVSPRSSAAGLLSVSTTRGMFRTRYLVGADGVYSQVRRKVFGNALVSYVPAVEALVPMGAEELDAFADRVVMDVGGMRRGYGWLFPKRNHLNVGVFSAFPTNAIKKELARFMTAYGLARRPQRIGYAGHAVPLKNHRQVVQDQRVWLVGDAAGLAESLYGEGIYYAIKSAAIAARSLNETFDEPESRLYTRRLRHELFPELRFSRWNARLLFHFPKLGFELLVRRPYVNRFFAGLVSGESSHRECFAFAISSLARAPFANGTPLAEATYGRARQSK